MDNSMNIPKKKKIVITDDNWDTVEKLGYYHVVPYLKFLYLELGKMWDMLDNLSVDNYPHDMIAKDMDGLEKRIKNLELVVGNRLLKNTD